MGSPSNAARLEGAQEGDELTLLGRGEAVEILDHAFGFAPVALDGVVEGGGTAIVKKLSASADSPKRRRAHFSSGLLATGLNDTVTSTDIVEQEVTVGMDDFVAE